MSGKKIPREVYKEGENFSMVISTNCTIDAITAINAMNFKKVKSISAKLGPRKAKLPGFNKCSCSNQFTGVVINSTKITAKPSPTEVFTVFDTARYEHIPRK
jgi:hypothetical protein